MTALVLYVAGDTADEACKGLLFDTFSGADEYATDEGLSTIWSVQATIDWTTISAVSDVSDDLT